MQWLPGAQYSVNIYLELHKHSIEISNELHKLIEF